MKKYIYILFQFIFCFPKLLLGSSSLNTSINLFASHFYEKKLAPSEENELFSPYCIFNCLNMAYLGADGSTEEEMAKSLFLHLKQEELSYNLKALREDLSTEVSKKGIELNIANSVWIDQKTQLLPSYELLIKNFLSADIESISFKNPTQSAAIINQWVKKQTKDTIPSLLTARDISSQTQLMLVSALYFKGSWVKPFSPLLTTKEPFFLNNDTVKLTDMMHQTETFLYHENEEMQMVLLPFSGVNPSSSELTCFIILPKNSLQVIETSLKELEWQDWMQKTVRKKVQIAIPKFNMEPRYDLIPTLNNMGMKSAFTHEADFSKINGAFDLKINKVIHQAFFAFDERGVIASAATAIGMGRTCALRAPSETISFTANHPFLFGIVDLKSNVVVFLGKMVNP